MQVNNTMQNNSYQSNNTKKDDGSLGLTSVLLGICGIIGPAFIWLINYKSAFSFIVHLLYIGVGVLGIVLGIKGKKGLGVLLNVIAIFVAIINLIIILTLYGFSSLPF